jgi:hypothetical protein
MILKTAFPYGFMIQSILFLFNEKIIMCSGTGPAFDGAPPSSVISEKPRPGPAFPFRAENKRRIPMQASGFSSRFYFFWNGLPAEGLS